MTISRRFITVLALLCALTTAQLIHAHHSHDNDHAINGLAVVDCSICAIDHFDDCPQLSVDSPFVEHRPLVVIDSRPLAPCLRRYVLSYARAPPIL